LSVGFRVGKKTNVPLWVGNCFKKGAVEKNKKHQVGLSVGSLVLSIFRFSVLSQWFTFQFIVVSVFFSTLGGKVSPSKNPPLNYEFFLKNKMFFVVF